MSDPCQSCGACCASFRVSFYWAESDAHPQGTVPANLTQKVNDHYVCMQGTGQFPVRCVALQGELGRSVGCSIYPLRSSTCREFEAGSESCNLARQSIGLPTM
ncbi:YkgJ family cysteine cluster protein [Methylophilus sp. Leaf414]|uniref:YkgJ family cysteine cluster protein n=1 Tax=Methylophilus sp. Leaf414 TaxID=1736371 RepID=UPI0009E8BB05|nr:YkgJ family cysteine cluster protein [Methylophilus sp. Leaf414]